MFRKMPFVLLAMIVSIILAYPILPITFQSIAYGMSLSLKSIILFTLPFLIFSLLFCTAIQIAKKASKLILGALLAICLSNLLSTLLSYFVGTIAYQWDLAMPLPTESTSLIPLGNFSLPKIIGNGTAMMLGLGGGLFSASVYPLFASKVANHLEKGINVILKGLLYGVPFFITGFMIKMMHDGTLHLIVNNYSKIFLLIGCALLTYIFLIYFVISKGNLQTACRFLKNMIPAAFAGFGSMSSAIAMPLTLLGVEKNAKDPTIPKSLIPVTVNIHLVGDCFAIPIFAFAILHSFGLPAPAFGDYLFFALYFVLAKFSVAAVPGGGILVMLPILESQLGLQGEMIPLITALYILFDPVITCFNILGNGGFALGVGRLLGRKTNSEQQLV